MKRAIIAALALLSSISIAFGQGTPKPKASLQSEITSNFPDCTNSCITPSVMRSTFQDFLASWQQYAGVNAQVGTSYTIAPSDYGQLVTFNNANPISVTIPAASGSFGTFSTFLKNIGAGTVTVTPAVGTIGGGANVSLTTGSGLFVVSDGTNWQTWAGASFGGSLTLHTRSASAATVTASATTDYFLCLDPTSNAIAVNLPGSPPTGLTFVIKDCTGQSAAHNITVTPAAGNIDGSATSVIGVNFMSITVTYTGAQWSIQ